MKEKCSILKLKVKESKISTSFNNFIESLYALYDYMLEDPIENFWYECFNIILSYVQIMSFIFKKEVSLYKMKNDIILNYSFGQLIIKMN